MGKYYAVANGRSKGVFTNWSDCESQVKGYSGARFKSFATQAEAAAFASGGSSSGYSRGRSYASRNYSSTNSGRSSGRGSGGSDVYSARSVYSGGGHSDGKSSKIYSRNSTSGSESAGSNGSYSSSKSRATRESGSSQVIYTDGSALGNGRRGAKAGWGVYWGEGDPRNSSGKVTSGEMTNNRGELSAIRHAVKSISREAQPGSKYEIRADSQYARDCLGKWGNNWEINGWKTSNGGEVKNQDLIHSTREAIQDLRAKGVDVSISYVPGHSGHEGNEAADQLARRGADS